MKKCYNKLLPEYSASYAILSIVDLWLLTRQYPSYIIRLVQDIKLNYKSY